MTARVESQRRNRRYKQEGRMSNDGGWRDDARGPVTEV